MSLRRVTIWAALMVACAPTHVGVFSPIPERVISPRTTVVWDVGLLGQLRSIYDHINTEFAGCVVGRLASDTIFLDFFLPGTVDPRTMNDSSVLLARCARVETRLGERIVATFHSHQRVRSGDCQPSGFESDSLVRDRGALLEWMDAADVLLGTLMCARGDSVVVYTTRWISTAMAVPPLDTLYARPRR